MSYPQHKGPWITLSSIVTYRNPWLSVREDQVLRPNGEPGIYGVVTMPAGSCILPVDDDGNVYLVRQYRYGIERETYEAIAGSAEGKDPVKGARKELKEEAGITADKIIPLGFVDPFTSVVNSPDYLFLATGISFGESELEGTEADLKVEKIPYAVALQWVMDSKITHSASVAVILKARDYVTGLNP